MFDSTILRLFISQAFLCYFFLILIPIKTPKIKNTLIIVFGAFLITAFNAYLISSYGLVSFYIRFFFLTLMLPYVVLFSYFAAYKGAKLIFALLSVELFGNVAIINGLFASYIFYGQNNPTADTLARILTFLVFLPLIYKYVGPQYLKMAKTLHKGWWVLNFLLIISYLSTYYIGFVPNPIILRPNYFAHAYIGLVMSLLIYAVIFFLFNEILSKAHIERDKQLLSIQVGSLSTQSAAVSASIEKVNIIRHDIRHHILILKEHIKQGDIQSVSALLGHIDDELSIQHYPVYCKNKMINAALSYYIDDAKQKNIVVDASLDIPELIHINPAELAIVFSNAIENAINACMKIEDMNKRKITLLSRYSNNALVLEITNPVLEPVRFDKQGLPITVSEGHGIGVLSILAFSKKNHAILEFSVEQDTFCLRILINDI
jgi:hypothetical protein